MGIVIMGCLVAGIDINKVFDHENHHGNSFDTNELCEIIWDADSDIIDGQGSVKMGEEEHQFNVFGKNCDNNPRVFATTCEDSGHSPAHAFCAVSQSEAMLNILRKDSVNGKVPMGLPPALEKAAKRVGITIPDMFL